MYELYVILLGVRPLPLLSSLLVLYPLGLCCLNVEAQVPRLPLPLTCHFMVPVWSQSWILVSLERVTSYNLLSFVGVAAQSRLGKH